MQIPEKAKEMMTQGRTIALATASDEGAPNVVPMLQYWWQKEGVLVIGDVFMNATRKNVLASGKVSFSVWDDETREAYKFNGTAFYETSGEAFEMANEELHKKKPDNNFKGVVVIKVTEVYDATPGENAGKLMQGYGAG